MDRAVGDDLAIGSRELTIVGIVDDSTALANQPNAFLTVDGAQQLVFGGQPLISSIGISGTPTQLPDGFRAMGLDDATYDMMRPLKSAVDAISLMAVLLWVVAALIVGSLIYLSALERMRDFAVFKAVGVTSRAILGGLVLQAVLVALLAAALGVVLSKLLAPLFPMQVVVPGPAFLLLPVVAVGTGLVASGAGVRRAVTVDPALAFGSK
jgi:putative ABC transport system permease protein